MQDPGRGFYTYRVTLTIKPVPGVPGFGTAIARLLGVLKRAGHDVTVEIIQQD